MKRILLFCIGGLFVFLPVGKSYGQFFSQELTCPNVIGKNVIMRTIKQYQSTFMYTRTNRDQCFYYAYGLDPYSRKFTIPVLANQIGGISYAVKDMKIIGKRGVVCGQMKTPIGYIYLQEQGLTIEYEEKGFVGWLDLDGIWALPSFIKYHLMPIEGTTDLKRLDVFSDINNPDSDTLVALIGTSDDVARDPCLVTMNKYGSYGSYSVYVINNPSEILTDVVFTEKEIATVSKFTNENRTFGVRFDLMGNFFNNNNANEYRVLNKFYTPGVPSGCDNSDTWHNDNVDIQMVAVPNDDAVIIAHDCWYTNPNDPNDITKWTALYHIRDDDNTPGITIMNAAKFMSDVPDRGESSLVDMVYNIPKGTVMLLNKYQQCSLANAGFSNINTSTWTCDSLKILSRSAMSMDYHNDNSVWIGGIDANDNYLFKFWQSIPHFTYPNKSCYENLVSTICDMDPRPTFDTTTTDVPHTLYYFLWSHHFILEAEQQLFERGCTKKNEKE